MSKNLFWGCIICGLSLRFRFRLQTIIVAPTEIPQKRIDLMEDLYTNTVSCVQADGVQSDWFPFSAGGPTELQHGSRSIP